MKKISILFLLFMLLAKVGFSQSFEVYKIGKGFRHVPLTGFEAHQDTLFFFLQTTGLSTSYYLGKFERRQVRAVSLPKLLRPTTYNMKSLGNRLYMVLQNPAGENFFYAYDGARFVNIKLPAGHRFDDFNELEVYRSEIYLGLLNTISNNTDLFRFNGTSFTQVPLCSDCFLGPDPETVENQRDEMIVYKDRLYIGGYLGLDPVRWSYPDKLFVYDGVSMVASDLSFLQWSDFWDHFFINENLLHTIHGVWGYDGTSVTPPAYHYPPVTGIDLGENPWATERGNSFGKVVYNRAVFYSAPMEVASGEIRDLLLRRFYSFSADPAKAREIFLPEGYKFQGAEAFWTELYLYNCRLFMFLEHDDGYERLVAYKDSFFSSCDFPRFPIPFPRFAIFPNPGDGLFTVNVPADAQGPLNLRVFNHTGKLILQQEIDFQNNTFDLREHGKGVYTAILNNGKPIRVIVK